MRGDSGDWMATTVNAPLAQGDKISTGSNSSAEIQLDHSNIIRLDQRTEARIATLSNNRIQIQVAQGRLNFTLFSGNDADVEIDTPNVALHPLEEGIYRIQVNSDSETEIICRKGKAEIMTSEGSTRISKKRSNHRPWNGKRAVSSCQGARQRRLGSLESRTRSCHQ